MEKNASPKNAAAKKPAPAKQEKAASWVSGISSNLFAIIKFFLGISLLPFVYGVSKSFLGEFSLVEWPYQTSFWTGIFSLLIIYLFIWEPQIIYNKGHKVLELVFRFFKPLVNVAPFLLPIFSLILFCLYLVLSQVITSDELITYFIFSLGVSTSLHLIFSARTLRMRQKDLLKANYIFGFSFVYITNLLMLAFFFNIVFKEFSFVNFLNNSFQSGGDIFYRIFKQFFISR